jgi:hypothetical protein
MSRATAIYTMLTSSAALSALIDTRVYPLRRPADSPAPCVVYQVEGSEKITCKIDTDELYISELSLEVYAPKYLQLEAICRAIMLHVEGYKASGIRGVSFMSDDDDYEDDAKLFVKVLRFELYN